MVQVDEDLAEQQAAALHEAGVQKLIGTDHDVFLEILGKSSRAQIQVRPDRQVAIDLTWKFATPYSEPQLRCCCFVFSVGFGERLMNLTRNTTCCRDTTQF